MKLNFTIQIWKKTNWYLAKCPELDFVAQGVAFPKSEMVGFEKLEMQVQ